MDTKKRIQARKVKAKLVEAGISHKSIAQRLSLTRPMVSMVVGGYRSSHRVRREIAKVLNCRVEELWPRNNCAA